MYKLPCVFRYKTDIYHHAECQVLQIKKHFIDINIMKVHVVLYTSNKADTKPRKGFIKGHFFVKN